MINVVRRERREKKRKREITDDDYAFDSHFPSLYLLQCLFKSAAPAGSSAPHQRGKTRIRPRVLEKTNFRILRWINYTFPSSRDIANINFCALRNDLLNLIVLFSRVIL